MDSFLWPIFISLSLLVISSPKTVNSSDILIVAPFFGVSHSMIMHKIGLHLASKGHRLTMLVHNLVDDPPENYEQIMVEKHPMFEDDDVNYFDVHAGMTTYDQLRRYNEYSLLSAEHMLSTQAMTKLIAESSSRHYDVVICEIFYQEALYPFAHLYRAPLVLVSTTTLFVHAADLMGVPLPYAHFEHDQFRDADGLAGTFLGTMASMESCGLDRLLMKSHMKEMDELAQKSFGNVLPNLPSIVELQKNVSLMFINTHFSFDRVVPLIPGIVQIGGVHIEEKSKHSLDAELEKFLDEARDGVIYFSLGSHLKSTHLSEDRINAFIGAFKKTKQRVVWKWENENPPELARGDPKKFMFRKWLPQFDVLGHKNARAFINHCGMLSIQEAIHHAVPVIGMPIFADQFVNLAKLVEKGMAVRLGYDKISESTVLEALQKAIEDESIHERAESVSQIFRDRRNRPLDDVQYWVEYVIRHGRDPTILKSPLVNVGYVQYYSVEIILALLGGTILCVVYFLVRLAIGLCGVVKRKGSGPIKKVKKK